MSQLIAMILRADNLVNPEEMTEVWRQPMPAVQLEDLEPIHYLDGMEGRVMEVGWPACALLQAPGRPSALCTARGKITRPGCAPPRRVPSG
jgi:hypothetical protein